MSTETNTTTTVVECQVAGSSSRATCTGIQGLGKNADICCASECTCTCGGSSVENTGKECYVSPIRENPPATCTGTEEGTAACILEAEEAEDTCGVDGITGIANSRGDICCPIGCGQCGGDSCGAIPMSWVQPGDTPLSVADHVPDGATSELYCCDEEIDTVGICGFDGAEPPCLIANGAVVSGDDTCGVSGVEGIANDDGYLCCPLGCPICGGTGCGAAALSDVLPGAVAGKTTAEAGTTTKDYCCDAALNNSEGYCGDEGVGTPCRLRGEEHEDTCYVEGMEGVSDPTQKLCCPIGCDKCTGVMCAETHIYFLVEDIETISPDQTSASYCCDSAFSNTTETCGVAGKEPPCRIPAGTIFPETPGTNTTSMTSMEDTDLTTSCDTVSLDLEEAKTFNGLYTMNGTDTTTFIRTDGMAVLIYEMLGDSNFLPSVSNGDDDVSPSTGSSGEEETFEDGDGDVTVPIDPPESSYTDNECGNWLLLYRIDGVLQAYPQVSVEDCAEHPQDIDPATFWLTQNGSNAITGQHGMGYIECVAPTMAPTPAPTMGATLHPEATMAGTSLPPMAGAVGTSPEAGPTQTDMVPSATAAPVMSNRDVTSGNPSSNSDSGEGLGETGAIVVGVVCGAALLIGVAGLARWSKRRNAP